MCRGTRPRPYTRAFPRSFTPITRSFVLSLEHSCRPCVVRVKSIAGVLCSHLLCQQSFISAYEVPYIYVSDTSPPHHQQTSRARAGASAAAGARRTGGSSSRGGSGGGGGGDGARPATKQAVQANGAAKVVHGLKVELATATETGMEKLEAGCDEFGEGRELVDHAFALCSTWVRFVSCCRRAASGRGSDGSSWCQARKRGGAPYDPSAVRSGTVWWDGQT